MNENIVSKILGGKKYTIITCCVFFIGLFLSVVKNTFQNDMLITIVSGVVSFAFIVNAVFIIVKVIIYFGKER